MKLRILLVTETEQGEEVLEYPFGADLHEFVLAPNQTVLVRNEDDTDVLVVARG
jgi:hypothetical protein